MKEIVLASNNEGKIKEIEKIFTPYSVKLVPQKTFNITEVEENGIGFIENALLKARHAALHSKRPALADDSGLIVPALSGAPGVYSARYAGLPSNDKKNNLKLLKNMQNISNRDAYFVCILVFVRAHDDPLPLIAQGLWHGEILDGAYGNGGFGYDPIFRPKGFDCSAAELSIETKNRLSHRALALQEFIDKYKSTYL